MIKPNYERIIKLDLLATNPGLSKGKIEATVAYRAKLHRDKFEDKSNNNLLLNSFLEEFLIQEKLIEFRDDLLFLSHIYSMEVLMFSEKLRIDKRMSKYEIELLKTLKYIKENSSFIQHPIKRDFSSFEIKIIANNTGKTESVKSHDLKWYIVDKLAEAFAHRYFPKVSEEDLDLIQKRWDEYLDSIYEPIIAESSRKGRRRVKQIMVHKCVYVIKCYLQKYTKLKAKDESSLSIAQSQFIYEFLRISKILVKPEIEEAREDLNTKKIRKTIDNTIRPSFDYWIKKILKQNN